MVALFKDTINHALDGAGERLNKAIELAGEQLDGRIKQAGQELNDTIKQASNEIHAQRKLTKDDIKEIVDYAADRFGETLDNRIEKLRNETSDLITLKISQVRNELTEAANQQKRVGIRNAIVAVLASILVGAVSLYYRKYLHGDIDLMDVFRSSMLALAAGYGLWLFFKVLANYYRSSELKRNAVVTCMGYFDILRPRGAVGQVVILVLIVLIWIVAGYSNQISAFVDRLLALLPYTLLQHYGGS